MTPKNVVAWMPESSCFRTLFRSQSVYGSQTLLKFARQDVYPNFSLIQDKLKEKTFLLVRSEIFGLFGKTLAVDHMYSRHNWEKFPQHVKTPLSEKRETFFGMFFAIWHSTQNVLHFERKDQLHELNILEVMSSKKCACLKSQKLLFDNTLGEPKCSRVPKNTEICMAACLS